MGCDMCGSEGELVDAIVEGSLMRVCRGCSQFGNVVNVRSSVVRDVPRKLQVEKREKMELVRDDFGRLIRGARERGGLKQEEVARSIGERESIIGKVESGQIKPGITLARKFERFYGIKLIDEYLEEGKMEVNLADKNLTIGDLIKIKRSKS